jgi:glycosyltransferase involved in cell wall biosynthesis
MSFTLNLPVNSVSFGQVSTLLLRELYKKNLNDFTLYPIGDRFDLSTQESDQGFFNFLQSHASDFLSKIKRTDPVFKLWHLNGSLDSASNKRYLLSFYELDNPTKEEINIVKNQDKVFFSSKYTVDIFKTFGCSNVEFLPLAFDHYNFKKLDKNYFKNDRIVFNLVGKLEKRKNHKKVIQAWIKKFGNNPKYHLQCSIYNPFLKEEDNKTLLSSILEGVNYFNISFLSNMPKNNMYNDYLNSADIIIGMSGGEGWGLPEFHSIALGKHAVILNAHSYKDWANKDNATLVEPNGKIEAYDGMFFHKGQPFNQGNIFTFDDDEFISACEKTIEKVRINNLNSEGLKLQQEFTSEKFADNVLKIINN